MYKVLITYDMQDGREQECQDYLVNKLAPGLAKLGLRVSDVWYTVWGESPHITSGGKIDDLDKARNIFHSDAWEKLAGGMEDLVTNFEVKVVHSNTDQDDEDEDQ